MTVGIICIAKDEERYLDEWIQYHFRIGIKLIYFFDNNDIGNDGQKLIIEKYPNIQYYDVRGRDALVTAGMQRGCYLKAYNEHCTECDYIVLLDIDEFLYFNELSVDEFVKLPQFSDTDVIHLNWKYYGDNDLVFYDNRPVQERFSEPAPLDVRYAQLYPENQTIKSIIKTENPIIDMTCHLGIIKDGICRLSDGSVGNMNSAIEPICHSGGFIKHYGTKTITEYIERRCLNTLNANATNVISATTRLNWFFNVNKHTDVKDKIASWFYSRGL